MIHLKMEEIDGIEIYRYTANQIGLFILFGMLLGVLMTLGVMEGIGLI